MGDPLSQDPGPGTVARSPFAALTKASAQQLRLSRPFVASLFKIRRRGAELTDSRSRNDECAPDSIKVIWITNVKYLHFAKC